MQFSVHRFALCYELVEKKADASEFAKMMAIRTWYGYTKISGMDATMELVPF